MSSIVICPGCGAEYDLRYDRGIQGICSHCGRNLKNTLPLASSPEPGADMSADEARSGLTPVARVPNLTSINTGTAARRPELLRSLRFDELYAKLTNDIPLTCPTCGVLLRQYVCPACDKGHKVIRVASSIAISVAGPLVAILGFLFTMSMAVGFAWAGGFMFGPNGLMGGALLGLSIGGFMWRDMSRRAATTEEVALLRLANRYQNKPDASDLAAACYLRAMTHGAMADSFPSEFSTFLRTYRCVQGANDELRTALFDGVIAQICGMRSGRWDEGVWAEFDAAYTGSSNQSAVVQGTLSYIRGEMWVGVRNFTQQVSAIQKAHDSGVDLHGVDLRLPGAYIVAQQLLKGENSEDTSQREVIRSETVVKILAGLRFAEVVSSVNNANGNRVDALALESGPTLPSLPHAIQTDLDRCGSLSSAYCEEFATRLTSRPWQERVRIASLIRGNTTLSQNVASILKLKKATAREDWVFPIALGGLAAVLHWSDEHHNMGSLVEGSAGLAILSLIVCLWKSFRLRGRRDRIVGLLLAKGGAPSAFE